MAEKEEKKVIEVEEGTLKQILEKLDTFEKKSKDDDKKIAKLLAVADKSRLANYESQFEQGELIRTCKLTLWDNSIVLGWRTIKNEVGFEGGVLREIQTVRLFLLNADDPKKEKHVDIDLLNFNRNQQKVDVEIIKESTDTKGRRTFTVRMKDGMELEYDIAFVN